MFSDFIRTPRREYALIVLILGAFIFDFFIPEARIFLLFVNIIAALPTVLSAIVSALRKKITIDTFNAFALIVAFMTQEMGPAAFILLMLMSAEILDFHTKSRAQHAVERLLKLRPLKAIVEKEGKLEEVAVERIQTGDILVVENGSLIPVDGKIIFGKAFVNEASVTGESRPVEKVVGDRVLSSTFNESGVIKIEATHVGKDSTIERMAALIKEASQNKSQPEKMADKFAAIFLPIVIIIGLGTYLFTKSITMTAAIFLVACADDMAVAIPLAVTAALGRAAKRGVIIKGGNGLSLLKDIKILILDKTGTLTYGKFGIKEIHLESGVKAQSFWRLVAIAEKFSEHPVGRAIFREAARYSDEIPDPDELRLYKGSGLQVKYKNQEILIGNEAIISKFKIAVPGEIFSKFEREKKEHHETSAAVVIDRKLAGMITVADTPRLEAAQSLAEVRKLGVKKIIMFTGDNEAVARNTSKILNIDEFRASMTPKDKIRALEEIIKDGTVAMVGDGINDAPALARADVGIAMGGGGTAVAIEAADVILLTDDLSRIPEIVKLSRETNRVIYSDMAIWFLSNLVGFGLVLTGVAGLAMAAFYNFATDFLPIINSMRLFKEPKLK